MSATDRSRRTEAVDRVGRLCQVERVKTGAVDRTARCVATKKIGASFFKRQGMTAVVPTGTARGLAMDVEDGLITTPSEGMPVILELSQPVLPAEQEDVLDQHPACAAADVLLEVAE